MSMGGFSNSFKEYRKASALECKAVVLQNEYQTTDDIRVLMTFAKSLGNDKFDWRNSKKISLTISELYSMISVLEIINNVNAPDKKYWSVYHPKNGVNKNFSIIKNGKYINVEYNDGERINISFETGITLTAFIKKLNLISLSQSLSSQLKNA